MAFLFYYCHDSLMASDVRLHLLNSSKAFAAETSFVCGLFPFSIHKHKRNLVCLHDMHMNK